MLLFINVFFFWNFCPSSFFFLEHLLSFINVEKINLKKKIQQCSSLTVNQFDYLKKWSSTNVHIYFVYLFKRRDHFVDDCCFLEEKWAIMQPDSASLPQVYQKINFWVFTNVMKFYRFRENSWIFLCSVVTTMGEEFIKWSLGFLMIIRLRV